ncbi:endonuclease/exonuclease/phosphatase family protein [Actinopolymorpha pittospori]|uniref:Endonuclease/exonuclease/phosphatase family metal-dependent hydrolase n=1 Tax=Actinopolymorpha pittospori TaxID=648752 RepID=A0A927MWF5_9ACTN|nr:endonuclease/exonuclease/phosphatase family metal-dependent hydrolase [Actinopolymorpha pittospori]
MKRTILKFRPRRLSAAAAAFAATVALSQPSPVMAAAADGPANAAGLAAGSVPLRVATYNIRGGVGEDGVFDLGRTEAAIRSVDAGVVGLQEVDVHWRARSDFADEARRLADRLKMRVFFAPIYVRPSHVEGAARRQYGVALLSRYPILRAENHEITRLSSRTPNMVQLQTLMPGFAEVTVAVGGMRVHVYSTHLDYRHDPSVRRAQVADMLNVMAPDHGPKVLVGDFNAKPDAPEIAALWQQGLVNVGPNAGKTYPATRPAKTIDLVTVSPDITVRSARVEATAASDHRPVVSDLLLQQHGR